MGGASVADRDVATHSLVGPWVLAWTRLVWRGVVWTKDGPRFVRQERRAAERVDGASNRRPMDDACSVAGWQIADCRWTLSARD